MPIKPADQSVRRAISDILSKFLSKNAWGEGPFAELSQTVLDKFQPFQIAKDELNRQLCRKPDLGFRDQHRFLYLEPVEDMGILPYLTLETSNQWVKFRAYVLLTMLDRCNELQTLAIRFETDEGSQTSGEIGSHDFCHAQLCRTVNRSTIATTPDWLPESQPSLPLDAEDQIGLVLCMLTSLYGGRHVVRRLNSAGDNDLRKHLTLVRALA